MPGLPGHGLYGFGPHVILSGKTVFLGKPVGPDKKFIGEKIFYAFTGNGTHHYLGMSLIVPAQEYNLRLPGMAYMIGDKGGIGNHRDIFPVSRQFFRQDGAIGTGLNEYRFPVLYSLDRRLGYTALDLMMISHTAAYIIQRTYDRKPMGPVYDPLLLQFRQIFPDRYRGNIQHFRQDSHFNPLIPGDNIQDFHMPFNHLWNSSYEKILYYFRVVNG
jgi:hypothetical protein